MILTKAKTEGFRRAGVAHPSNHWQEWPNSQFTAEQLAALEAEPSVDVQVLTDKPKGDNPENAEPPAAPAQETASEPAVESTDKPVEEYAENAPSEKAREKPTEEDAAAAKKTAKKKSAARSKKS